MNYTIVYKIIIGLFSVVAVVLMTLSMFFELGLETQKLLEACDVILCTVFFLDFIKSIYQADQKLKYFYTIGWIDLISSVPTFDIFRYGRLAKLVSLLRLIRIYKAGNILSKVFFRDAAKSTVYIAASFAFLNVLLSSVLILILENSDRSNIKTASDAIWWSFVTITTVGYGDHYPVTLGGRVVAVFLMLTGITLFGVITASFASFLVQKNEASSKEAEDVDRILEEIKTIKVQLEALNKK
jgi:voltage-gated potassium channel